MIKSKTEKTLVDGAIDVFVKLESLAGMSMNDYDLACVAHTIELDGANEVLKAHALEICAGSTDELHALQIEFYRITKSDRYRHDPKLTSIACSSLNSAWSGIGGWRP